MDQHFLGTIVGEPGSRFRSACGSGGWAELRRETARLSRKRLGFSVAALLVVVFVAGCRPAVDAPAETSAPPPIPASGQQAQRAPPLDPDAGSPRQATAASEQPPEPKTEASPEVPTQAGAEPESSALPTDQAEAAAGTEDKDEQQAQNEEGEENEPEPPSPLVDNPDSLERLHPFYPVWIDRDRKSVVMVGEVCQTRVPLELFACLRGSKEHESIVVVDTKAYVVHAGLLATGAESGSPVRFVPEFAPASGTEIEVTVIWEDQRGRRRRVRGQDWVQDIASRYAMFDGIQLNQFDDELDPRDQFAAWKAMEHPWVFAGSQFLKDERTGEQYYLADVEGDLICVSNFPSAVLDVPARSDADSGALLFEAFTERIPPRGTPVTLILTPQ